MAQEGKKTEDQKNWAKKLHDSLPKQEKLTIKEICIEQIKKAISAQLSADIWHVNFENYALYNDLQKAMDEIVVDLEDAGFSTFQKVLVMGSGVANGLKLTIVRKDSE